MNCANHPERERVSFCQNCGKPLCSECARSVGSGVFCEPCLAARLAAADAAATAGIPGYAASSNYSAVPVAGIPPVPGTPNPALAALLGFIPGVGAMYNGQYAKGVVHLVIFAVLVSLANSNNPLGILVAGWMFYQVFEAYHTARARRDGTPLPNPFGLNDIGERFGFGKAWPSAVAPPPYSPAPNASAAYVPPPAPVFTQSADGAQSFVASDGTHFRQAADGSQSYGGPGTYGPSTWGAPTETYVPPVPPTPPFSAAYAPPYAEPTFVDSTRDRFPAGAVWLIALGLIFFFSSSGVLRHFPIQKLIPFLLIGFGVWMFFRKMGSSGQTITDDGSPAYRLRLFRALRGSVWVVLVGVLFFLDTFDILSWGRSWPLFIITAGVMTLFERSIYNAAATAPYVYPAPSPAPQPPASPSASATDIARVPPTQHDEEGG